MLSFTFLLMAFTNGNLVSKEATIKCNQSYTINGGAGCSYNGTTHGWCSRAEFDEYANNIYSLEECGGDGYNPAPIGY